MNEGPYAVVRIDKLIKHSTLRFIIKCCCAECIESFRYELRLHNWEIIQKGSMTKMKNQAIILNKLYGKS